MKIRIRYTGKLPLHALEPGGEVEVEAGATVADLLARIGVPEPLQPFMLPVVNGERRELSHVLREGDRLEFFSPAGGG